MVLEPHAAFGDNNLRPSHLPEMQRWCTKFRITRSGTDVYPATPNIAINDVYGNQLHYRAGAFEAAFDTGYVSPTGKVGRPYQIVASLPTGGGTCSAGTSATFSVFGRHSGADFLLYQWSAIDYTPSGTVSPSMANDRYLIIPSYLRKSVITGCRWTLTNLTSGRYVSTGTLTVYGLDKSTSLGSDTVPPGYSTGWNRNLDNTDGFIGRLSWSATMLACGVGSGTLTFYVTINSVEYLVGSVTISHSGGGSSETTSGNLDLEYGYI